MSQVHCAVEVPSSGGTFAGADKDEGIVLFGSPGLAAPQAQHLSSPSLLLTRQVSHDQEPVGGARCASGLNCREEREGGK